MDANGKLRLMLSSGGQSSQPGVVRDVGHLAFDELAKEWELLVIGHDIWRAPNLSLCDEHLQMGHDLVFQLLGRPDRNESGSHTKGGGEFWGRNGSERT